MAISVVNGNGNVGQEARNVRAHPPAPPNGNNQTPSQSPLAVEAQNSQVAVETDSNAAVVIRRLTPLDVVERDKAPDVEPIPQRVNVPDPFTNITPDGNSPALQVQIARLAPESPENAPAQAAINAVQAETQAAQTPAPAPAQNEAEVTATATDTGTQAAEPPAAQPPAVEPQVIEPAVNANTVATTATPQGANNAATQIQRAEAEGQATNNPIAEQEIGGTVNIAV